MFKPFKPLKSFNPHLNPPPRAGRKEFGAIVVPQRREAGDPDNGLTF
jgi:hypothetical protein